MQLFNKTKFLLTFGLVLLFVGLTSFISNLDDSNLAITSLVSVDPETGSGSIATESEDPETGSGSIATEPEDPETGSGSIATEPEDPETGSGSIATEPEDPETGSGSVITKSNTTNNGSSSLKGNFTVTTKTELETDIIAISINDTPLSQIEPITIAGKYDISIEYRNTVAPFKQCKNTLMGVAIAINPASTKTEKRERPQTGSGSVITEDQANFEGQQVNSEDPSLAVAHAETTSVKKSKNNSCIFEGVFTLTSLNNIELAPIRLMVKDSQGQFGYAYSETEIKIDISEQKDNRYIIDSLKLSDSNEINSSRLPAGKIVENFDFPTITSSISKDQITPTPDQPQLDVYLHSLNTSTKSGYNISVQLTDFEAYGDRYGDNLVDRVIPTETGNGTLKIHENSQLTAVGSGWVDQIDNEAIKAEKDDADTRKDTRKRPKPDGIADNANRGCLLDLEQKITGELNVISQNPEVCLPDPLTVSEIDGKFAIPEIGLLIDNTIDPIQPGYESYLAVALIPIENVIYKRFKAKALWGSEENKVDFDEINTTNVKRVKDTNLGLIKAHGFQKGFGLAAINQRIRLWLKVEKLTRSLDFDTTITLTATTP